MNSHKNIYLVKGKKHILNNTGGNVNILEAWDKMIKFPSKTLAICVLQQIALLFCQIGLSHGIYVK